MGFVLILVLFSAASAVLLYFLAARRGLNAVWWSAMGLMFGPLAIPFVFLVPRP
jgi:hypothetical protein